MKRNFRIILVLMVITVLGGAIYGSPGILDLVDPSFNPQIQTNSFISKEVTSIVIQPDGKILIAGNFNSYNRQLVSKIVRLNADATLDTTFNAPTSEGATYPSQILLQADGKIIVGGLSSVKPLIRLNVDGTIDPTFDFNGNGYNNFAIDANGRILLAGNFPQNNVNRKIIRLNPNGSEDSSFFYAGADVGRIIAQNNKVIIHESSPMAFVKRLNEDGTPDNSFTATNLNGFFVSKFIIQPDAKILVLDFGNLRRLNQNGGDDAGFTPTHFPGIGRTMNLSDDGRITASTGNSSPQQIKRFLANGTADNSFTPYNATFYSALAVQADGGVIIGDSYNGGGGTTIQNNFLRLLPNGTPDITFNVGGIGFQTTTPGYVRTIAVQPDGKIIFGGKFDSVNDTTRFKIARLNADSTLDTSFQINTSGAGNSFLQISDVYHAAVQADGKIIISGNFYYSVNGAQEQNVARLNPNGSIDSTFNLNVTINDLFGCCLGGTHKPIPLSGGKLIVGTSRSPFAVISTPLKLNADGTRDTLFNPTVFAASPTVYILDLVVQPDGKIIIVGITHNGSDVRKGFVARLNPDGSTDQTFQIIEETDKTINVAALLPNGKILIVKAGPNPVTVLQSDVLRLNSDGTPDAAFNAGTGANGKINALLPLPNGKIFVGGKFTAFNGQARQNLARLNADGSLDTTIYNLNDEVLSLAIDGEGRVLVGGTFTTINAGGGNANRSYIARLIDSTQATRTRFDFDGDGRADLGVYTAATRTWSILNSLNNQSVSTQFGLSNDKTVPADFDGDGKTDIAVYRPSEGNWYLMRSTNGFGVVRFGASGDKPVAGDFDGDGKADIAVWRPNSGDWWILQSSNGQSQLVHFGLLGDIPLPDTDFDGDGRADIAVWRPSNGNFYWLASGSGNQFRVVHFGTNGDIPAVADYNGDGKADLVVYRPTQGNWYQYLTTPNGDYTYTVVRFGLNGDVPVPADYNGDGRADIALWRQGTWHFLMSNQGYVVATFGGTDAQAVAALSIQ